MGEDEEVEGEDNGHNEYVHPRTIMKRNVEEENVDESRRERRPHGSFFTESVGETEAHQDLEHRPAWAEEQSQQTLDMGEDEELLHSGLNFGVRADGRPHGSFIESAGDNKIHQDLQHRPEWAEEHSQQTLDMGEDEDVELEDNGHNEYVRPRTIMKRIVEEENEDEARRWPDRLTGSFAEKTADADRTAEGDEATSYYVIYRSNRDKRPCYLHGDGEAAFSKDGAMKVYERWSHKFWPYVVCDGYGKIIASDGHPLPTGPEILALLAKRSGAATLPLTREGDAPDGVKCFIIKKPMSDVSINLLFNPKMVRPNGGRTSTSKHTFWR